MPHHRGTRTDKLFLSRVSPDFAQTKRLSLVLGTEFNTLNQKSAFTGRDLERGRQALAVHRDTSSCSRPGAEPWGYSDKGDDDNGTAPALPGTRVTPLSATGSLQRVKETTAEVAVGARSPLKAAAGGLGTAEPAEVAGERGLRTTERAVFGNRDHGLHSVATRLQRSRGSPASLLQVSSPSASEAAAGGVPCARPRRSTPGIARPTEGSMASARRLSATRPEGVGICPRPRHGGLHRAGPGHRQRQR